MTDELDSVFGLPSEIVAEIFADFTATELCSLSLVCKAWQVFISSAWVLWERLVTTKKASSVLSFNYREAAAQLSTPIHINFKLLYRAYISTDIVRLLRSIPTMSVITLSQVGDYVVFAGILSQSPFTHIQIWKCSPESEGGDYLGTILPGSTTCVKITSLLVLCYPQDSSSDELEIYVGCIDGTIDIFKVNVTMEDQFFGRKIQTEVIHLRHFRGNIGPIDWMCGIGHLFISKSSLSKRKTIYSQIIIFDCLRSSHYASRNSESFKNKENEPVDLNEMMKKLSIQLAQSLRLMRSVASRPLLERGGLNALDTGLFSELISLESFKQHKPINDYTDYDILFWNMLSRQCIRQIRQSLPIDSPIVFQNKKSTLSDLQKNYTSLI